MPALLNILSMIKQTIVKLEPHYHIWIESLVFTPVFGTDLYGKSSLLLVIVRFAICLKSDMETPKTDSLSVNLIPGKWHEISCGWWFGTFFIVPYIGNSNLDWLSYVSRWLSHHQPDHFLVGSQRSKILPGISKTNQGVGSAFPRQVRLRGGDLKPLSCGELRANCRCVWGPCLGSNVDGLQTTPQLGCIIYNIW